MSRVVIVSHLAFASSSVSALAALSRLEVVKSAHAVSCVSITPLAALEESAVPLVAELTERVQPVTLVTIGLRPSLLLKVSKSELVIIPSSLTVSSVLSSSLLDEEEEESPSVQDANAASVDVAIISDKKSARSLFLRELVFFFIQPPFLVLFFTIYFRACENLFKAAKYHALLF